MALLARRHVRLTTSVHGQLKLTKERSRLFKSFKAPISRMLLHCLKKYRDSLIYANSSSAISSTKDGAHIRWCVSSLFLSKTRIYTWSLSCERALVACQVKPKLLSLEKKTKQKCIFHRKHRRSYTYWQRIQMFMRNPACVTFYYSSTTYTCRYSTSLAAYNGTGQRLYSCVINQLDDVWRYRYLCGLNRLGYLYRIIIPKWQFCPSKLCHRQMPRVVELVICFSC